MNAVKVYVTVYQVQLKDVCMKSTILLNFNMYEPLKQKGLFQQFFPIRNCCILAAALVPSVGGYISDIDLFLLYKE